MHTFKLHDGTDATFHLTIRGAQRIESKHKLDLTDSVEALLEKWIDKPTLRLGLFWDLCDEETKIILRQKAEKRNEDERHKPTVDGEPFEEWTAKDYFYENLEGDAIADATQAAEDEIVFFSHQLSPSRGARLKKLLESQRKLVEKQIEVITRVVENEKTQASIDRLATDLEKRALDQIGKISIESLDN